MHTAPLVVRLGADTAPLVLHLAGSDVTASRATRTIEGVVAYYGRQANASTGPVTFLPGSLRLASELRRVKLLIDHDQTQPVGFALRATDSAEMLRMAFSVPEGPAGDEALTQAENGLRDGFSVGVWPTDDGFTFDAEGGLIVSQGDLREVTLCALPAFDDARVTDVAATAAAFRAAAAARSKDAPMPCTICGQVHAASVACTAPAPVAASTTPAAPTPAAAPLAPVSAAVTITPGVQAAPVAPPNAATGKGLTLKAAARKAHELMMDGNAGAVQAALVDVIVSDDAGESLQPQWVGELWSASKVARPFIDAIGPSRPLTGLKVVGFHRVYDDLVDDWAGDKTAIPSFEYTTAPAEADVQPIAGGNDIDRMFVDLGGPSFIEDWFVSATDDYRNKSEAHAIAIGLAAATAIAGTTSALGAISAIAARLVGVGASLDFVVLSPAAWTEIADLTTDEIPWWLAKQGNLSIKNQDGSVSDVSFTVNPTLTGNQVFGGDSRFATPYEVATPIRVQAANVALGGIDVSVHGYIAVLVNDVLAAYKATFVPA